MEPNNLFTSSSKEAPESPPSWPFAALFSFGIILLFEVFVFYLPPFLSMDLHFAGAQLTWKQEVCQEKNAYSVLFLGESFGLYGFKPRVFDAYSSYAPSFNLCVYQGSTFLTEYYFLKEYLKRATKYPKVVLLEFTVQLLFDDITINDAYLQEHLFPFLGTPPELLQEVDRFCTEYRILNFPCWKRPMQGLHRRLWNGKAQKKRYQSAQEIFHQERGYVPFGLDEKPNTLKLLDLQEKEKRGKLSPVNTFYIDEMIRLLKEYEIPVLLILPPIREDRKVLWNQYQIPLRLAPYLKELRSKHSNLCGIATEFLTLFPRRDDFQDILHLQDRSAEIFSRKVAQWLNTLALPAKEKH
jgi:hypothetical protein